MDDRILNVMNELKLFNPEIEVISDMISFIPTYDFEVQKKILILKHTMKNHLDLNLKKPNY